MSNEHTPDDRSDQTPGDPHREAPIGADDPTPRHPEASAASADASATAQHETAAAPAAPRRGRGILKPILIGTGAAAVVLAVAGVGMSIADAVDDGDDPAPGASTSESAGPGGHGGDDDHDDGRGGDRDDDDASAALDGSVPTEPGDLVAAIEAALEAAGGGDATSVELERDGWKVDVLLADGGEVEVRVPVSGDPVVRADDDGDRSSDLPLDPERVEQISDAAIAAAGGGVVTSIETEESGDVRFEVEVVRDGQEVDVELADDLSVLAAD
ncbi:PepSY domain-containing protein [Agrococcus sp. SCSIO52902]|uniref:PepSY domain-containing protein n=1 Tax=Agrococcus sp. SCSIO52902 TaxID=2933290 RepID=UPI001FF4D5AA|nr:PepSY domain-containing protein [Agrococcus sp. SCSIO52902]UOW01536.1 hypothetical protein MU522_03745 [Agrococcus sp. SCSIO52902]